MGGKILLTRGLIGVGAGGMIPIRHERAAVTPRELFVARVTVVDDQQHAALDGLRDLAYFILREDWNLDALRSFRMDSVAVEKLQFFGEWREPSFMQTIVFERDVEFPGGAEYFDRKG